MSATMSQAKATAATEGDGLTVRLGGVWRITEQRLTWAEVIAARAPKQIRIVADEIEAWDSSLALFVREAKTWSDAQGVGLELSGLPPGANQLAQLMGRKAARPSVPAAGLPDLFSPVGAATYQFSADVKDFSRLVGECLFSAARFCRGQVRFRWADCLAEMQQCGLMAVPIVGLISFLTGVTMAYVGAIVLRMYGGDIWIADMVGLAVTREMGPMMAAIVLAGRTGAAFAATIGNMKANDEIDAISTLGISPVDFLVMPRVVALLLMMPLLALYSNLLGLLGGLAIAATPPMNIAPSLYFAEMKTIVDLSDIMTGLIKAATYGILIGISGCWRGLQADRSAAGVGQAATSAVVTAILLIVVSDSIYAVCFNILGW